MARVDNAYRTLVRGDTMTVVYGPREGVTMRLNGRVIARAQGHRAVDAILVAWAEDEPIEAKLDRMAAQHPC